MIIMLWCIIENKYYIKNPDTYLGLNPEHNNLIINLLKLNNLFNKTQL